MATNLPRRPPVRTGKQNSAPAQSRTKPLKRPLQARAKFTVQAIYDAFVRLWRDQGWEGVTTRAVALETGVSVGTLYEYFPNKQSLLSGYVRHCIDVLLSEIDRQAIRPVDLPWRQRVHLLVRLTCGMDAPELPYFDPAMLMLEYQIAEPKHHRRVYEELLAKWEQVIDACRDLPRRPEPATVQALYLSVWGARRYYLLVGPQDLAAGAWVEQMEILCRAALESGGP